MKIDWLSRIKDVYKDTYIIIEDFEQPLKSNTKLNFLCKEHGVFSKYLYQVHRRREGCPKCSRVGAPKMDNSEFVERLNKYYNNNIPFKLLEEYKGFNTPILVEEDDIKCKISPQHLLKGTRINMRNTLDKTALMINKFNKKHNNYYDYSKFQYRGNRELGTIICPTHGEFQQMTDVHLMGSGCSECGKLNKSNGVGWSKGSYCKFNEGKECLFYILMCWNDEELFFKIGITNSKVSKRYKGKYEMPYHYEIISQYVGTAEEVWNMELAYKRLNKKNHYVPNIYFKGGSTECFSKVEIISE